MDPEKFGRFIAEARKEKRMTQGDLASILNVTDKAVSRWERGQGFPDINSIEPLADALGTSVLELMRSEKNIKGEITDNAASEAISDAFEIIRKQRWIERKHIILICVGSIISIAILLMFDNMELMGGVMIYLPVVCLVGGSGLIIYGIYRYINNLTCMHTFIGAGVLLAIPAILICILFFAFYIGGPVPN